MPSKTEFRVVWKRRGQPRKSKRFMSLKAAQRRVRLLGPEPWTAFEQDPDERYCCSGHECGCGGRTLREHLLAQRAEGNGYDPEGGGMPAVEYVRIEQRPLGDWSPVSEDAGQ